MFTENITTFIIRETLVGMGKTLNRWLLTCQTGNALSSFVKEGNPYLMTHLTHFIYGYMACEKVNPLPPLYGLLSPISSKE